MAKIKWKELDGELKVVVQAIDVNGNYRVFHFNVYVDKSTSTYDKQVYIQDIAQRMTTLRNCYFGTVLAVEQVKANERRELPRKDKKKNVVHEGDIIRYTFKDNGQTIHDDFLIKFKDADGSLGWCCQPLNGTQTLFDMFSQSEFSKHITIIGNKFDNPELLKARGTR